MPQAQRFQYLIADLDLFNRIGGEAHAQCIANPHPQQVPKTNRRFDRARRQPAGLGDAKVDRRIRRFGQGLIGGGGHEHIAGLYADLEFVEIIILQDADMLHPAFDHRIGTGFAVFVQQVLFQTTGIHTDPDGTAMIAGGGDHLFDALFIPDIARIDPQAGGTGLGALNRAAVMEMDVGDDGHRAFGDDLFQGGGTAFIGHRDAHDIGTGLCGSLDLCNGGRHIRGDRVGHRLHRNRRIASDGDVPNMDLTRFAAVDIAPRAHMVQRHLSPLRLVLRLR